MDRFRKVLSFVLLASVIVTACGAEETGRNLPASEPVMTETPSTSFSHTEPANFTTTPEPMMSATSSANTPQASIPVTGEINPGRLSHLVNFDLYNQTGEQIGEVDDLILDLDAARATYVIVGTGGFLDIGEKHVAVPWSALQIQAETNAGIPQNAFVLITDQELFVNAPDINMNEDLPEIGQPASGWDHEFRGYWNLEAAGAGVNATQPQGTPPATDGMPLQGIITATEALGFDFKLKGPEDLDVSIDDMIIDVRTGEIMYVVIHTNFENAGEQWIPVPRMLLGLDVDRRAFILDIDPVTLQGAPFYINGRYPNTTLPGWDDTYIFFWKEHGLNAP